MNNSAILAYVTAATTFIAGVLHINKTTDILKGESISNADVLFLIGGIAQVFWIVPIIKKWRKTWYLIGIAGTIVFILLWAVTRLPDNPITGRSGPISVEALTIQAFQIAFIILSSIMLISNQRKI